MKHKDRIFWKNLLENKKIRFKNGVKNIKAAAYSEWRTYGICNDFVHPYYILPKVFSFDYPYFWIMSYDTFLCFLTVEMSKSLKTSVIRFTYICINIIYCQFEEVY